MFHLWWTELGRKWTWPTHWRASSSHIFIVRMDNRFVNENLPYIFVDRLVATWRMDKKCVENGSCLRGGKTVSWSTSKLSGKFSNCSSSVCRAHKRNVGNVVFYYTGFDSLARFVGGARILSESIHHACLSSEQPGSFFWRVSLRCWPPPPHTLEISLDFPIPCVIPCLSWRTFSFTRVDFTLEQTIQQSKRSELSI
jgi:hypothetical protein